MQGITHYEIVKALMRHNLQLGPPCYTEQWIVDADADAYARMACPECHKRHQEFHACQRDGEYVGLVVCRNCGCADEV